MSERIAALLAEAADLHHRVHRRTDGADPDWPSWYAAWLVELSELPDLLGRRPTRTELTCLLVELDREAGSQADEGPWQERYADRIAARFAG
jgi:hypothetical protein